MVTIRNEAILPDRGNYYRSETKYLSQLVGHEVPEEKRDFFKALAYTNKVSDLGLDAFDVEVLGRMLTALSKQTRFYGTDGIAVGENAATHSLHCITILDKIIAQTATKTEAASTSPELSEIQQYAGLSLVLHDLAEILGEPKTATGVSIPAEKGYSAFEAKVLEETLKMALVGAREDLETHGHFTQESRDDFANNIADLVSQIGIEKRKHDAFEEYKNALRSRNDLSEAEKQTLKENTATRYEIKMNELEALFDQRTTPRLTSEDQIKLNQYMARWEMAEYKQSTRWQKEEKPQNQEYIGQLVKAVDHIQGVRHYTRFGQKEVPAVGSRAVRFHDIDEKDKRFNLWYVDNDAYHLHQKCSGSSTIEAALAMATQNEIYAANIGFVDAAWRAYDVSGDQNLSPEQAQNNKERLEIQEGLTTLYEDAILQGEPAQVESIGRRWLDAYEQNRGAERPSPRVSNIMDILKSMVSSEELVGKDTAWKTRMETRRTQSGGVETSVA